MYVGEGDFQNFTSENFHLYGISGRNKGRNWSAVFLKIGHFVGY